MSFVLFLFLNMSFCKCKCIWCIFSKVSEIHPLSIGLFCKKSQGNGHDGNKNIYCEIENIFTNCGILDHSIIYNKGRLVCQCFADKIININIIFQDTLFILCYIAMMIIPIFVQKFEVSMKCSLQIRLSAEKIIFVWTFWKCNKNQPERSETY